MKHVSIYLQEIKSNKYHNIPPVRDKSLYADGRTDRRDEANSRLS